MGASGSQPVVTYDEAVKRLPEEWLEAVRLSFQEMSKHNKDLSGKVTKQQFREFYGAKVISHLGPIFDRLFEVLDQDGDGSVDFEEFMSGMFIFGRGSREEKLKFLFKLYDINGDGLLSREEFDKMLRGSLKATQAAMGALLLTETTEYNDLVSAVRRNLKESGPRITYIIDSIFNETDLNRDGYLSYDEFKQWATGKGKDDLHIDQWMDSLLPQRIEQLKLADEKGPNPKEEATLLAEDIRLDATSSRYVQVLPDGRTVKYTGSGVDLHASSGYQTGLVHPDVMVDTDLSSLFYFEFTLTDAGLTGGNAIGFYPADETLSGAPGWYHNSYGYHADEGCRYFQMKKEVFKDGSRYTERPWGTGDVVGAGINKDTIFFTRNGKRLEPSYTRVQGVFYPVVCFTSPGAVGVCNFGEKPFKYDLGAPQESNSLRISVVKPRGDKRE
ncbi:EF hand,SPla/RYanodine receptor (SPRY) domain containing protein [Acanthamoeba castellanii str. Neff]|uniref:EF hand,SPla/RYanodine receptor (SPRY) domain containing protein n=1 Tax=Acanthamoeba castellanii (strain ATCC 30010 / Neff) TaxID=1257118 RepID=L8H9K0_ACACF|nr:EF hand,SPla/RYanodine receptor (SPRY) domain containing protein [Acanthamoeba castellanii str. Neff]ELR21413.1 EF hand,SPla/RYanodine receptor (SPRY) domain containing protein [Acanthamoeba castellanii str. Neff]